MTLSVQLLYLVYFPERCIYFMFNIDLNQYAEARQRSANFISTASRQELLEIFPGNVVSPGDCLFPINLKLDKPYRKFLIQLGGTEPVTLCFSKVVFAGLDPETGRLCNLAPFARCSQSSGFGHMHDASQGVNGELFADNVHTKKEINPWWQADFPDDIYVRFLYFYRRVDIAIIHEKGLRIIGVDAAGVETELYAPYDDENHKDRVSGTVVQGLHSLELMRMSVASGELREFDSLVTNALVNLGQHYDFLASGQVQPISFWQRLRRFPFPSAPKEKKTPVKLTKAQRHVIADSILKAAYIALGKAKDFGLTEADALKVAFPRVKAREIRFRVFGAQPPGFRGATLYGADKTNPIHVLKREDLTLRNKLEPFRHMEAYSKGLWTDVHSRKVDLGDERYLEGVSIWNLNRPEAGNTVLLEISVRSDPRADWEVVYDHGALYRQACDVLRLADYLIRSAWPDSYGRLLGKLFTQYRRLRMMRPVAKLTRKKETVSKAVFEGSKVISANTKYASPLVLGKHGLQVPLSFRPENVIMGHLVEIRDKVKAAGHTPLFMYGTLLGAIREKDFIPHDDDLDLAVILEGVGPDELMTECKRLIETFNEAGVTCNLGSPIAPLIHCHRGPVTIDIFVLGHVEDTIYWPHAALKIVAERASIFLPTSTLEFKGEIFDAPHDPEAVSEARYGSDWYIPNPEFEW